MKHLLRTVPVVLLLTAACSGGSSDFAQPAPEAFTAGACRDLAPPVLDLGRDLHQLADASEVPESLKQSLKDAQAKVRAGQPKADTALAPAVQELVTTVGYLRLAADTRSYQPQLAQQAGTAYDAVVAACTPARP